MDLNKRFTLGLIVTLVAVVSFGCKGASDESMTNVESPLRESVAESKNDIDSNESGVNEESPKFELVDGIYRSHMAFKSKKQDCSSLDF